MERPKWLKEELQKQAKDRDLLGLGSSGTW